MLLYNKHDAKAIAGVLTGLRDAVTLGLDLEKCKREKERVLRELVFSERKDVLFFCQFTLGEIENKTYIQGKKGGKTTIILVCKDEDCPGEIKYTHRKAGFCLYHIIPHNTTCIKGFCPRPNHAKKVVDFEFIRKNSKNQIAALKQIAEARHWQIGTNTEKYILYGDVSKNLQERLCLNLEKIEPYMCKCLDLNPNCFYRLDTDDENYFTRLMFIFPWSRNFQLMNRIVAIDSCHMNEVMVTSKHIKNRKKMEETKFIALVTKSSNNHNIVLAFSLCLNEKAEEFSKLLQFCVESGVMLNTSEQAIISDRAEAIRSAISKSIPQAYHICCPLHLKRNLLSSLQGLDKRLVDEVIVFNFYLILLLIFDRSFICFKLRLLRGNIAKLKINSGQKKEELK